MLSFFKKGHGKVSCVGCGYEATFNDYLLWKRNGKRGNRGKLPSGHIVIACPECDTEMRWDSLLGRVDAVIERPNVSARPKLPKSSSPPREEVICPYCKGRLSLAEGYRGDVDCPHCEETMEVYGKIKKPINESNKRKQEKDVKTQTSSGKMVLTRFIILYTIGFVNIIRGIELIDRDDSSGYLRIFLTLLFIFIANQLSKKYIEPSLRSGDWSIAKIDQTGIESRSFLMNTKTIIIAAIVLVVLYYIMSPYQNCVRDVKTYGNRTAGFCAQITGW
jgi:hypothetical protein